MEDIGRGEIEWWNPCPVCVSGRLKVKMKKSPYSTGSHTVLSCNTCRNDFLTYESEHHYKIWCDVLLYKWSVSWT